MAYHSIGALGESNDAPSRSQIEAATGIRIPSDATGLRARIDQVLTKRTAFVRFSLPTASVAAFLADSAFREPLREGATLPDLLLIQPHPEWFTPAATADRGFCTTHTPRAAILVDATKPARSVIYLVARS